MLRYLMFFLLLSCLPWTAVAQDTPETAQQMFPDPSLKTHAQPRMLVVGAGTQESIPQARQLATSLRERLRTLPDVELVMDASSLGDVSSLSDKDLLERTRSLPLDVVVIVRAYPSKAGHTYVLKFQEVRTNTSYSTHTVPGSSLLPKQQEPRSRRKFHIVKQDNELFLYVGKKKLQGIKIYEHLQRPDLASEYQRREDVRNMQAIGLFGVGSVGVLGGSLILLDITRHVCGDCNGVSSNQPLGLGLIVGGLTLWALTSVVSKANIHPLTGKELQKLSVSKPNISATILIDPNNVGILAAF